jgi:hypothetical protein
MIANRLENFLIGEFFVADAGGVVADFVAVFVRLGSQLDPFTANCDYLPATT